MANKILKIALALSIGTFTLLQAKSEYVRNYNNNTINVPSSKNDKIFIREYKYNASDSDSKISSRKKAIAQLKSILSEEVGVHIQSSFDVKQTSHNKYVKKEINQLSASITKLKIIEEKWNGVTYYIKASVKIDEEQTMNLLLEAIKAKASQKDVKRLNRILKEQNGNLDKSYSKIKQLQKKLVLQEIKNQASKDELIDTKRILQKLKKDIKKYDNEIVKKKKLEKKYKTELARKKELIKELNKFATNNILKLKRDWKNSKNLLCSLSVGVNKKSIDSIDNRIRKIDCGTRGGNLYVDGSGRTPYYNGYYKGNGITVKVDKCFSHVLCPSEFITGKKDKGCVYFSFLDGLISDKGGCK